MAAQRDIWAEERIDWPGNAAMALSIVVNVEEGSEQSLLFIRKFTKIFPV